MYGVADILAWLDRIIGVDPGVGPVSGWAPGSAPGKAAAGVGHWGRLGLIFALGLLSWPGCGEVTRPAPTMQEVEACQLAATKRHPYQTWSLERVSRVFIKELACLPQVHGHTYPFLGFNWWVTEAGHVVVDNVWYPSPAKDVGLKQGDIILGVNNWPLHPWVRDFNENLQGTYDILKKVSFVSRSSLSGRSLTSTLYPGEVLVALLLDFKHAAMDSRGQYLRGPVELLILRDEKKFLVNLYPQHLPAEYGVQIATKNQTLNAYADKGRVILTQRLVNFCLNDDELALIIGHELAHQALGHLVRGAGHQVLGEMVGEVVTAFATLSAGRLLGWRYSKVSPDIRKVASGAVVSVYSQDDEREADAYGLWYAYQAGYDIDRGLAIWERMAAVYYHDPFEHTYFLDSHPAPLERLARLKKIARYFTAGRAAEVFLQSPELDRRPPPE
jgi:Zn-dependent protease with chaperone function